MDLEARGRMRLLRTREAMRTEFIAICAWCLRKDGILTILDGTPVELALLALGDDKITHGICPSHYQAALQEAGIR